MLWSHTHAVGRIVEFRCWTLQHGIYMQAGNENIRIGTVLG
ncbi:hypothetical protein BVRB_3g066750 [Beta vulgaris subsp. vulgaris]|nr:hypothetical protein BVRB_3g066750 [Beta vulgaris subsp. vulgaris]